MSRFTAAIRHHPATGWLTYALFVLFFTWLLWSHQEVLASLQGEDARQFAALAVLALVMVAGRGLLNLATFRPFCAGLGIGGGFELAVVQTMGNYLPFSAGLVAKAVVLKRRYHLPYDTYSVVSFYTYIVAVTTSGFLGLVALWRLMPERPLLASGFAAMASTIILLYVPMQWPLDRLFRTGFDWVGLRRRFRGIVGRVLLLYVGLLVLSAVRLVLAFGVFDHPIGLGAAGLLSSGSILSRRVNLTPGAKRRSSRPWGW